MVTEKIAPFRSTMNEAAVDLFDEMLEMEEVIKGKMVETRLGPTILDVGLNAPGGLLAGEYTIQVCMGGLAEVSLTTKNYSNELTLPAVLVSTDHPAVATIGSQFAGWAIKKEGYQAIGSGPARILAKKPKTIYEQLPIIDDYPETVIVLEANAYPPDAVLEYLAQKCNVPLDNLCVLLAPTTSMAGAIQIAGRSIETALHQLFHQGMDILTVKSAMGVCPIAPLINKNAQQMMGRTNDMLTYGAEVFLQVAYDDDTKLKAFLSKAVSSHSSEYGRPFFEILQSVGGDFYKIDPGLFAPAKIIVNNTTTGSLFTLGGINFELLKKSILQ
ncbi:MAG: methenyltetrahydromethanopterin cyclohydrolase [Candidatus Heimdallarchaeota archaeon]|nr:methenyltetrahydromethanopterin cyclohydrolase [Candidatus Heimdallarchaeota archaeon]